MKRADANARESAPIPTHIRTRQAGADLPQRAPIRWWKGTIIKSPIPGAHHGSQRAKPNGMRSPCSTSTLIPRSSQAVAPSSQAHHQRSPFSLARRDPIGTRHKMILPAKKEELHAYRKDTELRAS